MDPPVPATPGPRLATRARLPMVFLTSPELWVVVLIFTEMIIPRIWVIRTGPEHPNLPLSLGTTRLPHPIPKCGAVGVLIAALATLVFPWILR